MPSTLGEQSAVRTLTLGEVRATYVVDGAMGFSPATFFPTIPSDLWASLNASGMVPMSAGGLLVESGGRRLLIDVGLGPMQRRTPAGATDSGALLDTLAALGHDPESIDVVALTHLHADHAGWVVRPGHRRPGLPPRPPRRRCGGMGGLSARRWHAHPAARSGHPPLQLAHPEWGSGPDSDSESVPAARRRLFGELSVPGTIAFAAHFGDQPFGRIVDGGWSPVPSTVLLPPPRQLS